jgi:hypothetical protein
MSDSSLNKSLLSLIAGLNSDKRVSGKKSLLRNLDWPTVVTALKKTGTAGYFYILLSQTEACLEVPAEVVDAVKKLARLIAAHNAFYESECAGILSGLSAIGVDCLLLKGFSFMQDIYGDTAARRMNDIDLLIRPDDRIKVLEYLLAEGYSAYVIPNFKGNRDDFISLTDLTGEAHFIKKLGVLTATVDLHWRLRACYPMNDYLSLDKFPWWEHMGSVIIGSVPAIRLSPEMQFIHMAVHFAAHHQYMGIRWFIELSLFMKKFGGGLDWEFIYNTASSRDCRKLLGVCLRLAADYMGPSWPGSAIWRKFLPGGTTLPGEYLFYKNCLMRNVRSRFAAYICMLLSPATLAGRLRMLHHFLFDPQGVILWRESGAKVPKWLRPFHALYIIGGQLLRGRRA